MFFAWRVYRVTRKTWLSLPAAIGAVIRSTFAALCGILVPVKGFESFKIKFGWMFYLALSLSTAVSRSSLEQSYMLVADLAVAQKVDVWVTASLCYHLWNRRTAYNRCVQAYQCPTLAHCIVLQYSRQNRRYHHLDNG
jgi:hypothetical protein